MRRDRVLAEAKSLAASVVQSKSDAEVLSHALHRELVLEPDSLPRANSFVRQQAFLECAVKALEAEQEGEGQKVLDDLNELKASCPSFTC